MNGGVDRTRTILFATAFVTVLIGSPHGSGAPPDMRHAATHSADLNGDRRVDLDDLLALLAAWGPCPDASAECRADFDVDGEVGVSDLLVLLHQWTR